MTKRVRTTELTFIVWPAELLYKIIDYILHTLSLLDDRSVRVEYKWFLSIAQSNHSLWNTFKEQWNEIKARRWCVQCRLEPAQKRLMCLFQNPDCQTAARLRLIQQDDVMTDTTHTYHLCADCALYGCELCGQNTRCGTCLRDWSNCSSCARDICDECATDQYFGRCGHCRFCCLCSNDEDSCELHDECIIHIRCPQCHMYVGAKEDLYYCTDCHCQRCSDCLTLCSICVDNYRCDECHTPDREANRSCVCIACYEELGERAYTTNHMFQ